MLSDGLESVCSSQQHPTGSAGSSGPGAARHPSSVDNLPFELVDNEVDD